MFKLGDTWELSSDDGVDSWFAKLQKITSDRGFDKVLFGLAQRNHQDPGAVLIVDNYPVQWRADYDSAKYTTIEPVVAHSAQHCTPLVWADSAACFTASTTPSQPRPRAPFVADTSNVDTSAKSGSFTGSVPPQAASDMASNEASNGFFI